MKSSNTTSNSQKKPEDNTKLLENIRKIGSNKECFDCSEKVFIEIIKLGYNISGNAIWNIRLF